MLDIRLRYQENGKLQSHTVRDLEQMARHLKPGDVVRAKLSTVRSVRQNNYLHALADIALDNRQSGCEPGPELVSDHDQMKAWLLIQANHCDVDVFDDGELAVSGAKRLRRRYPLAMFTVSKKTGQITMRTARETRGLSKEDMSDLIDRVRHIISERVVPGVDPDSLFEAAKQRAA